MNEPLPRKRTLARWWIGGSFLGIAAVHVLVGSTTHGEHILHAVFGAAYLLLIVAAAAWLGPREGVLVALAATLATSVHLWSGAAEPMERLNQAVLAVVNVFVGIVAAVLVGAADRERRARLESERSAQREALVQSLAGLSIALRERDDGTAAHCERVVHVAERIGAELDLPPERQRVLRLAALVHDLGKIGVRDDVLLKPGELTADERARIERHPAIAAEILRPIRGIEEVADIVLSHHECPDGTGYPRRLPSAGIPPLARILRVADVYDALAEARPYKEPMPPGAVLARMLLLEGKLDGEALSALGRWLLHAGALRPDR